MLNIKMTPRKRSIILKNWEKIFQPFVNIESLTELTYKMDKTNQSLKEMGIIDPKERIKALTDHASRVVIDPNIAPKR